MTALQWEEIPTQAVLKPNPPAVSSPALSLSNGSNPPAVSLSNPWFAVAMGLLGLIIGYALSNLLR